MQVSSPDPDFAFDEKSHFLLQHGGRGAGTDGIILKSIADNWLVLALLNSTPLDYYLKHISTVFSGKTYSYSDAFIKQLPIKLPISEVEQEKAEYIATLAKRLTYVKDTLEAKKHDRDSFPEPQSRSLPAKYDLYPLRQFAQGTPQTQTFKRSEVRFGQQTFSGGIAMQFGKTSLILSNQLMVDVVKAWIRLQPKQNLRVGDLLSISVPQNTAACQQLLTSLSTLEKEITSLQTQLVQDEAELNNRVTDYYRLNVDDQKVIADFLDKF